MELVKWTDDVAITAPTYLRTWQFVQDLREFMPELLIGLNPVAVMRPQDVQGRRFARTYIQLATNQDWQSRDVTGMRAALTLAMWTHPLARPTIREIDPRRGLVRHV